MKVNPKIIVNLPLEEIQKLERAASLTKRTRNNFVLSSALFEAEKILKENSQNLEGSISTANNDNSRS